MIQDDEELAIEQHQLRLIEEALDSLRLKLMPNHPRNFALYSEGYVDQINILKAQIDEYLARTNSKVPAAAAPPTTARPSANVP
jgi:hypothetical protein